MESKIIELIATDRIEIPISSLSGKLKRLKPKIASEIIKSANVVFATEKYKSDRVYARIETSDQDKARSLKEAIEEFCEEHPKYGEILKGKIAEKRVEKETHLYFGMNEGKKLTSEDYMGVMRNLGFSEERADSFYHELIAVSRNISRKRDEERCIMIGKNKE